MEKRCFIILPLTEPEGYAKGHFNRVYQYIIVPACRNAGFSPFRMGDPAMDDTPFGIINTMIESEIVLCDISSNDQHALYGFAIRQATGLAVTLMKDIKTNVNANIPEFDIVEYDESLRIDTVQNEVETLSEALKKAFDDKPTPNEIIRRLNIETPPVIEAPTFSTFAEVVTTPSPMEEDVEKEAPLPIISPLPGFVGLPFAQHEIDILKPGDFIFHLNYGKGEILTINHKTRDVIAKVHFDSGSKILVVVASDIFRKINPHV